MDADNKLIVFSPSAVDAAFIRIQLVSATSFISAKLVTLTEVSYSYSFGISPFKDNFYWSQPITSDGNFKIWKFSMTDMSF